MVKIIAKTIDGKEFMYSRASAHAVSASAAEEICKVLNENAWGIKPGEKWHIYDVGEWELSYMGAAYQKFTRRKGVIREVKSGLAYL